MQTMRACVQALSHFSYHISKRDLLLCDLQGAAFDSGAVLTDPVIISNDGRFGPADMGARGMANFFHHHTCNRFCRPEWRRPARTAAEFPKRRGTSMVRRDGAWLSPANDTKAACSDCAVCAAGGDSCEAGRVSRGIAQWIRGRRRRGGAAATQRDVERREAELQPQVQVISCGTESLDGDAQLTMSARSGAATLSTALSARDSAPVF